MARDREAGIPRAAIVDGPTASVLESAPCTRCGAPLDFGTDHLFGYAVERCYACGTTSRIVPRRAHHAPIIRRPRELTPRLVKVLEVLSSDPDKALTTREISERAQMDRQDANNAITVLVRAHRIARREIPSALRTGPRKTYLHWRAA